MATIEHDGFTIESNTETEAAMRAAMQVEPPTDDAHPVAETEAAPASDQAGDATPQAADADSGESTPEAKPEKKAKPRDNPQARISQAIAKQHDAERKAAELEARLAALEAQRTSAEPAKPPAQVKPEPSGKPSWKGFEAEIGTKYETWADAQDAFADARETYLRQLWQAELREQAERTEQQKLFTSHVDRVKAARQTYPDFDDRVNSVSHILASPTLQVAIAQLPNSADVVYYLATHEDEFAQLASETQSLGAEAAPLVRRLLEARMPAGAPSGTVSTPQIISNAKPPIKPVGSSPVATPVSDSDEEPFDDYFKRANARDRKAGRL